jgi:hypothetical protein
MKSAMQPQNDNISAFDMQCWGEKPSNGLRLGSQGRRLDLSRGCFVECLDFLPVDGWPLVIWRLRQCLRSSRILSMMATFCSQLRSETLLLLVSCAVSRCETSGYALMTFFRPISSFPVSSAIAGKGKLMANQKLLPLPVKAMALDDPLQLA